MARPTFFCSLKAPGLIVNRQRDPGITGVSRMGRQMAGSTQQRARAKTGSMRVMSQAATESTQMGSAIRVPTS